MLFDLLNEAAFDQLADDTRADAGAAQELAARVLAAGEGFHDEPLFGGEFYAGGCWAGAQMDGALESRVAGRGGDEAGEGQSRRAGVVIADPDAEFDQGLAERGLAREHLSDRA